MNPNYVAKKSIASVVSIWLILFSWLIIPLFIQIARIISTKCYSIEFYDNKIVVKSGWLSTSEKQSVFKGVYSVSVSRSLKGRIFNYGNVSVDCPGYWDIDTNGIKDPNGLKAYLQEHITAEGMTNIVADGIMNFIND